MVFRPPHCGTLDWYFKVKFLFSTDFHYIVYSNYMIPVIQFPGSTIQTDMGRKLFSKKGNSFQFCLLNVVTN